MDDQILFQRKIKSEPEHMQENPVQEGFVRSNVEYVLDQESKERFGINELPSDEVIRAYMDEVARIKLLAEEQHWKPKKLDTMLKKLNAQMVKEAKEAERQKKSIDEFEILELSADEKIQVREHDEEKPLKTLTFTNNKFSISKETRKHLSAQSRVEKKEVIHSLVEKDLRNPFLTKEMKSFLESIKEYSEIRTTASGMWGRFGELSLNPFSSKSFWGKRRSLARERELLIQLRGQLDTLFKRTMPGTLFYEMLEDYKSRILDRTEGALEVPADQTQIDDYSTKDYKMVFDDIKEKEGRDGKKTYSVSRSNLSVTDRTKEPLFAHEPCAKDVVQKSLGDCYFLASLARIASTNPEKIREMMKDEGKTVVVRFYNKKTNPETGEETSEPKYIRVSKKTSTGVSAVDTLWVQLMEKAYAIFMTQNSDKLIRDDIAEYKKKTKNVNNPNEINFVYIGNGGQPHEAMQQLLGGTSSFYVLRPEDTMGFENIDSAINRVFENDNYKKTMDINDKIGALLKQESILKSAIEKSQGAHDKEDADLARIREEIKQLREQRHIMETGQDSGLHTLINIETSNGLDGNIRVFNKEIFEELKAEKDKYVSSKEIKKEDDIKKLPQAEQQGERTYSQFAQKSMVDQDDELMKDLSNTASTLLHLLMGDQHVDAQSLKNRETAKTAYEGVRTALKDFIGIVNRDGLDNVNNKYAKLLKALVKRTASKLGDTKPLEKAVLKLAEFCMDKLMERFDTVYSDDNSKIFTGRYTREADRLYDYIVKNQANGRFMVASTNEFKETERTNKSNTKEVQSNGIAGRHAYSILGAEEMLFNGKKLKFIKVRNPWALYTLVYKMQPNGEVIPAQTREKNDGVFYIELTHFMLKYHRVSVAG